ncbi:MAG: phosphonopyruvate hydrolase [Kiloniellales bacterium]|nr:phosphonopyruvate hydrolase [Kiloniellales bacterium]
MTDLRALIDQRGLVQIMATHSPLSARLAEEAGFDGLWASGFELSALLGLPDVSLITMSQHLEMLGQIQARCKLPIVADIDTGFGNAVNVVFAIQEYERAGATAIVIEDKTFPKVTSLAADGRQELLRIEEFQGKIEAACATRSAPGFLVIARTEALIAGLGQEEAHRRARAYVEAGADMVLVHSKQSTPDEIEAFIDAWDGAAPLVLVPTAYPEMTLARIRATGKVGMVIWGNHAIRPAVTAMQQAFARIIADGGIHEVDKDIVPVSEIFRLQDMDAVKKTEKRFLR